MVSPQSRSSHSSSSAYAVVEGETSSMVTLTPIVSLPTLQEAEPSLKSTSVKKMRLPLTLTMVPACASTGIAPSYLSVRPPAQQQPQVSTAQLPHLALPPNTATPPPLPVRGTLLRASYALARANTSRADQTCTQCSKQTGTTHTPSHHPHQASATPPPAAAQ